MGVKSPLGAERHEGGAVVARSDRMRRARAAAGSTAFFVLAPGVVVLIHAFARFILEGIGTPAPVAPTERLVVGGLYRYVRNPMYLAVVACIVGQALALGQPALLLYAVLV